MQIECVRIACGGHTCVLSARGELFTFGNGKHGQLGHGEGWVRADATPRRVGGALLHQRVLGLACGDFHTLALAEDGGVYTWGAGGHGELGHGDASACYEPRRVESLHRRALVYAACGASHNIVLLAPPPSLLAILVERAAAAVASVPPSPARAVEQRARGVPGR